MLERPSSNTRKTTAPAGLIASSHKQRESAIRTRSGKESRDLIRKHGKLDLYRARLAIKRPALRTGKVAKQKPASNRWLPAFCRFGRNAVTRKTGRVAAA